MSAVDTSNRSTEDYPSYSRVSISVKEFSISFSREVGSRSHPVAAWIAFFSLITLFRRDFNVDGRLPDSWDSFIRISTSNRRVMSVFGNMLKMNIGPMTILSRSASQLSDVNIRPWTI